MFKLRAIFLICSVNALTDVERKCIKENSELLSNDYLLGTWYKVYHLSLFGRMVPSCYCPEINFTRPSTAIIDEYKHKYNAPGLPYNLNDNPILYKYHYFNGMVIGREGAKFYVLSPNSSMVQPHGYSVIAYKPLSQKFLMKTDCAMRGHVRDLWSRDKNATVEEMEDVIKKTPKLMRLEGQRFCATPHC